MDANKKKLIFFLGSVFVAVIFLTSYAAFSNNGGASSTTTTIKSQATVFATGDSNAIVYEYGSVAYVSPVNATNSSKSRLADAVSQLESTGSVQNYIETNGTFQLILNSNMSAYALQQWLYKDLGNGTARVGSNAYIRLPSSVQLHYNNAPIGVYVPISNYSVYMASVVPLNSTISVGISALLLRNGSVYNNQFRVSLGSSNGSASNSSANSTAPTSSTATTTVANSISKTNTTNSTPSNSIPNANNSG
ncbi:MAG: hypothetical protein KGI06_01800 [Candidatus Micrarchaeota archaeon]|nr:hypothetical protein [Candidatus Micrarchaeota archaeon]